MAKLLTKSVLLALAALLITGPAAHSQRDLAQRLNRAINLAIEEPKTHPSAVKVARLHYSGGGDWVSCIEELYGVDGNISEDPDPSRFIRWASMVTQIGSAVSLRSTMG